MTIWVDADSCPTRIREIIFSASLRRKIPLVFVANRNIPFPSHSDYASMVISSAESQSADNHILENAGVHDIVITRDIPLAYALVQKEIITLNDRGTVYTRNNVGERLSVRNLMYDLRSAGFQPERTHKFNKKDIQQFAQSFDKILAQAIKHLQKNGFESR